MPIGTATTYEVLLWNGDAWAVEPRLRFTECTRPVWPELPTATLQYRLDSLGKTRFGMEEAFLANGYGQKILVRESGASGRCVFVGFITGNGVSWGDKDESVTVFAKHWGTVLQERFQFGVHSRGYEDYDEEGDPIPDAQTLFPGWPAILNPEGRGNMTLAEAAYKAGGETETCRLFCQPVSPGDLGTKWTSRRYLTYAIHWACQASADINLMVFPDIAALPEGDLVDRPNDLALDGLSWWEAIGKVLEQAGWRCRVDTTGTGDAPTPVLSIWKIGTGPKKSVVLPAIDADLDGSENAQSAPLNFDVSGTVNLPVLSGGPLLVEGCWPLIKAWKVADFDFTCGPDDEEPWKGNYWTRYVADTQAAQFHSYQDVGRRWALNEGGDYNDDYTYMEGPPPVFDIGTAVGEGLWARRRRSFKRPISETIRDEPKPVLVEICFDAGMEGGDHWHPFRQAHIASSDVREECAIHVTATDLSEIKVPHEPEVEEGDASKSDCETYWDAICADQENQTEYVRVRITAALVDDSALAPDPALAVPAWCRLEREVEFPYDRGRQYDRRIRLIAGAYASRWFPDYGAATRNGTLGLTAEAATIQNLAACVSIRGPIVLFGTGYAFDPGDQVTGVDNRSLSFVAGGDEGDEVYPEVVQVTLRAGQAQSTEILLEDPRQRLGR